METKVGTLEKKFPNTGVYRVIHRANKLLKECDEICARYGYNANPLRQARQGRRNN